jgi:hypothetical protein
MMSEAQGETGQESKERVPGKARRKQQRIGGPGRPPSYEPDNEVIRPPDPDPPSEENPRPNVTRIGSGLPGLAFLIMEFL